MKKKLKKKLKNPKNRGRRKIKKEIKGRERRWRRRKKSNRSWWRKGTGNGRKQLIAEEGKRKKGE